MVQSFSFLVCYMFPLGTSPSSDVQEPDHQLQTEVLTCVDLLCVYTLDSNFANVPSLGCEVPSFPLQNPPH
jgi:hypothetical protein